MNTWWLIVVLVIACCVLWLTLEQTYPTDLQLLQVDSFDLVSLSLLLQRKPLIIRGGEPTSTLKYVYPWMSPWKPSDKPSAIMFVGRTKGHLDVSCHDASVRIATREGIRIIVPRGYVVESSGEMESYGLYSTPALVWSTFGR